MIAFFIGGNMLTQEKLKEYLSYDKDTGIFTWLKTFSKKTKPGCIAGRIKKGKYSHIFVCGKSYKAHRLAWLYVYGEFPTKLIDHIDGEKNNNSIANLRLVDHRQNMQNLTKLMSNNTTGFLGVSFDKRSGKFMASIRNYKKKITIGYFDTAELASAAYILKKRELHECGTM